MAEYWTITTNHELTRRKTFFVVQDPQGEVRFKHRFFWPCVEYLDAEEQLHYIIQPSVTSGPPDAYLEVLRKEQD